MDLLNESDGAGFESAVSESGSPAEPRGKPKEKECARRQPVKVLRMFFKFFVKVFQNRQNLGSGFRI